MPSSQFVSTSTYNFITMAPPPPRPMMTHALEAQAGQTGVTVWQTGTQGRPYDCETLAADSTFAAVLTLADNYRGLMTADPVQIVFGGVTYLNVRYKILDVVILEARKILVGRLMGAGTNAQGTVRARWTLLPIPFTEPP